MSMPPPPPGQGPVDPRGAFAPPPPPMGGMPPPMPMPMPMMMPPPYYPPPPRGGGFARAIFVTLATSIFGLSIAMNLYLLILTGVLSGEASTNHVVVVKGDPTQKVATIKLEGIIDSAASERFAKLLREIEEDANVKALVVELDTPGGGVTPSDEIYAMLLKFRETKRIPVAASIASLGASGGYYVACAAEHIFAETTSITGSIGVYSANYNIHEMLQKWGVKDTTVVADGAPFKTAGSSTTPPRPEDEAYIKVMVNQMHDRFKEVVQAGRGSNLKGDLTTVASGKIFTAKEAKDLGLIDTIDYPAAAYAWVAGKAGLGRMHVVRYDTRVGFLSALGGEARSGSAAGVTINGINLNVDHGALDHLLTPRMMYLWRGQ